MARRSFGGGPAKEQTQGPSTTSTDSQANHPLLDLDLELQIPFDALNAGFPYVALTATRRKSPPKRSLDEAPSRIFLP